MTKHYICIGICVYLPQQSLMINSTIELIVPKIEEFIKSI